MVLPIVLVSLLGTAQLQPDVIVSPGPTGVEVTVGAYRLQGARAVMDQKAQRVTVEGTAGAPALAERLTPQGKAITSARTITIELATGKIVAKDR
jgi:hypothetical protein